MQQAADGIGMSFDATQWEPNQTGGVRSLPIGTHTVIITGGGIKTTNDQMSGYLELDVKIVEGPQMNATGVIRYNLYNKSKKAAKIAHEKFSALCHVIGVFRVDFVSQIANKPFKVQVEPQADQPQFTEVVKVFDVNGNEPRQGGAPAQQQQAQPQVQQGGHGAAPSWAAQVVSQPAAPPQAPPAAPPQNYAQPGPAGPPAAPPGVAQQPAQAQAQWNQPQQGGAPVWDQPPAGAQQGPPQTQWAPPAQNWGQ